MDNFERQDIERLDPKYRPLSAWAIFGYQILFSIPFIGFICVIVCALSNSNINRRNLARSYFCGIIIVVAVILILVVSGSSILSSLGGLLSMLS